jgi:hypothetical protein
MPKLIDLTGHTFGQLTARDRVPRPGKEAFWRCICDCGNEAIVSSYKLRTGHTRSCGCLWLTAITASHSKHGLHGTGVAKSFQKAKARCRDPRNNRFHHYGGRGIEFRFGSVQALFDHLGHRPEGMELDRIDPNGHYEPGNVRWWLKGRGVRRRSAGRGRS